MFQTTNHLSDQTTKHILSFYFRIEFVKIGIYTHVFIMNKYLRYNQEWIFPAEITKKKKSQQNTLIKTTVLPVKHSTTLASNRILPFDDVEDCQ